MELVETINTQISDKWGVVWSKEEYVRDFYQNFFDANNTRDIEIKKGKSSVSMKGKSSFDWQELIVLGSDKKGDDSTIGEYGEGFKAALVNAMREGVKVEASVAPYDVLKFYFKTNMIAGKNRNIIFCDRYKSDKKLKGSQLQLKNCDEELIEITASIKDHFFHESNDIVGEPLACNDVEDVRMYHSNLPNKKGFIFYNQLKRGNLNIPFHLVVDRKYKSIEKVTGKDRDRKSFDSNIKTKLLNVVGRYLTGYFVHYLIYHIDKKEPLISASTYHVDHFDYNDSELETIYLYHKSKGSLSDYRLDSVEGFVDNFYDFVFFNEDNTMLNDFVKWCQRKKRLSFPGYLSPFIDDLDNGSYVFRKGALDPVRNIYMKQSNDRYYVQDDQDVLSLNKFEKYVGEKKLKPFIPHHRAEFLYDLSFGTYKSLQEIRKNVINSESSQIEDNQSIRVKYSEKAIILKLFLQQVLTSDEEIMNIIRRSVPLFEFIFKTDIDDVYLGSDSQIDIFENSSIDNENASSNFGYNLKLNIRALNASFIDTVVEVLNIISKNKAKNEMLFSDGDFQTSLLRSCFLADSKDIDAFSACWDRNRVSGKVSDKLLPIKKLDDVFTAYINENILFINLRKLSTWKVNAFLMLHSVLNRDDEIEDVDTFDFQYFIDNTEHESSDFGLQRVKTIVNPHFQNYKAYLKQEVMENFFLKGEFLKTMRHSYGGVQPSFCFFILHYSTFVKLLDNSSDANVGLLLRKLNDVSPLHQIDESFYVLCSMLGSVTAFAKEMGVEEFDNGFIEKIGPDVLSVDADSLNDTLMPYLLHTLEMGFRNDRGFCQFSYNDSIMDFWQGFIDWIERTIHNFIDLFDSSDPTISVDLLEENVRAPKSEISFFNIGSYTADSEKMVKEFLDYQIKAFFDYQIIYFLYRFQEQIGMVYKGINFESKDVITNFARLSVPHLYATETGEDFDKLPLETQNNMLKFYAQDIEPFLKSNENWLISDFTRIHEFLFQSIEDAIEKHV